MQRRIGVMNKEKNISHPYLDFEGTEQWEIIRNTLEELIENNDLELYTPIEYVVGAICKELAELKE